MPISTEEAKKYEGYQETEIEIVKFLEKNKGKAFLKVEIMDGIGVGVSALRPDEKGSYWTWPNVTSFALAVAYNVSFQNTLDELSRKGKIED